MTKKRSAGATPESWRTRAAGYSLARKFRVAFAGIVYAVRNDFSVRYKLVLSGMFLVLAARYETLFHFLFVLSVTGLMLAAELFNTAVEEICDYVQPNDDQRIKVIKDVAAGATMVAILLWWSVLAVVLYELFVNVGARQ